MKRIDFPQIHFPIQGIDDVRIPRMARVRQRYPDDWIGDIPGCLKREFVRFDWADRLSGKRIAVTVGSRGIPDNAVIVRAICEQLRARGAEP